jgi:hypothetical protein
MHVREEGLGLSSRQQLVQWRQERAAEEELCGFLKECWSWTMDCILEDQNHGGKDAEILEVPSQIAYTMNVSMQGFRQGLKAAL